MLLFLLLRPAQKERKHVTCDIFQYYNNNKDCNTLTKRNKSACENLVSKPLPNLSLFHTVPVPVTFSSTSTVSPMNFKGSILPALAQTICTNRCKSRAVLWQTFALPSYKSCLYLIVMKSDCPNVFSVNGSRSSNNKTTLHCTALLLSHLHK